MPTDEIASRLDQVGPISRPATGKSPLRTIVACLHGALASIVLGSVGFLWVAAEQLAPVFEGWSFVPGLMVMVGKSVAIALILIAGVQLVAAIAAMFRKRWAWIVIACFGVVLLPIVPVGTAIGAFTLWAFFLREEAARASPIAP